MLRVKRTPLLVPGRGSPRLSKTPLRGSFTDFSEAKFSVAILVEYNFYGSAFDESLKCSFMFLVAEIKFLVRHML
jgi:hypothetical protein